MKKRLAFAQSLSEARRKAMPVAGLLLLLSLLAVQPAMAQTYSVLHSFTGPDGSVPGAGLTRDASGNLYGTTITGGASGAGVVFKLNPADEET